MEKGTIVKFEIDRIELRQVLYLYSGRKDDMTTEEFLEWYELQYLKNRGLKRRNYSHINKKVDLLENCKKGIMGFKFATGVYYDPFPGKDKTPSQDS